MSTSKGGDTGVCGNGIKDPPTGLITKDFVGDKVGTFTVTGGDTGDCGKDEVGDIPTRFEISELVGNNVGNPLPGTTTSSGGDTIGALVKGFSPFDPLSDGVKVGTDMGNPATGNSIGGDTGEDNFTGYATGATVNFGSGDSTGNEDG